jgi:Recombinase zinc beta ribbon domain
VADVGSATNGQHRVQGVDESTWVRRQNEALRIVPEDLWQAAHEHLATTRAVYLKSTSGKAWGRPANGVESRYLLTGLGSCGACGGSIFVHSHDHQPMRRFFYGCMVYHLRGRSICKNNLEVPMESTDRAVLEAVERDVLRIEVIETALAKAMEMIRPRPEVLGDRARGIRAELARLDGEVTRLAAAIAAGGEMAALVAALQERERRRAQLRAELAALDRASTRDNDDMVDVLDQLRGHLTDWQGMLRSELPAARLALRSLLVGRLIFTPRGEGADRYYEFEGPGTVSKIIAGLALPKGLVTPGSHARWWRSWERRSPSRSKESLWPRSNQGNQGPRGDPPEPLALPSNTHGTKQHRFVLNPGPHPRPLRLRARPSEYRGQGRASRWRTRGRLVMCWLMRSKGTFEKSSQTAR